MSNKEENEVHILLKSNETQGQQETFL